MSVVAPPKHNPDARFLCEPCVLVFTGSTREAQAEADDREAKRTEGRGVEVSSWVDQAKDRLDGGAA